MRIKFNTDSVSVSKPEPNKDGVTVELDIDDPTMRDLIIGNMNRVFPSPYLIEAFLLKQIPNCLLISYADKLRKGWGEDEH